MVVDADPATAGIQASRIVPSGGSFDVDLVVTTVSQPYIATQWTAEWNDASASLVMATSNDDGNPLWDGKSTGFDFCLPATNFSSSAPVGIERWNGGCASLFANSTSFTGPIARLTLTCGVDSVVDIHLSTLAELGQLGTTLINTAFEPMDTATVDASVTCGNPLPPCLTKAELQTLRANIRENFGVQSTDPAYDARYDVDESGTIDSHDLSAAAQLGKCWVPSRQ